MAIDPISLAATVALNALSYAMTASKKIEGPRLESLKVSVADYGTALNYFYGTRRFEGCPIIWAEDIREKKKKRKTKGGKYNEYTYYGTFAFVVADHEIDKITRVWFDRHLVYDITGSGPVTPIFSEVGPSEDKSWRNKVRFYTGTESQEADPRMQAWVEARFGADSCPAYRGVAYVVVEELPLEKFGNRIPQITTEATTAGSDAFPYETYSTIIAQPARLWGFTFSPDHSQFLWGSSTIEVWDTAARSRMYTLTIDATLQETMGISNNGTIYYVGEGFSSQDVKIYSPDTGLTSIIATTEFAENLLVVMDGRDIEHVVVFSTAYLDWFYHYSQNLLGGPGRIDTPDIGDKTSWSPKFAFTDSYGDVWVAGLQVFGSHDDLYLYRIVDTGVRSSYPGFIHINHGYFVADSTQIVAAHHNGHFIVYSRDLGRMFKIEDEGLTLVDSVALSSDVYNVYKQWANLPSGSSTIWMNVSEVSLDTMQVVRTVNILDWKSEDADGIIYDPINHALICAPQFDQVITFRFLDRVTSGSVTLRSIIEDIGNRVDQDSAYLDATDCTQTLSYSWTRGSGKEILEPLLQGFDSFVTTHDFTLTFKRYGVSPSGTINSSEFISLGENNKYDITLILDTDLPRRVTVNYADLDADQQPNAAQDQHPAAEVDTVNELTLNLSTVALDPDTAQQLTERWFRRLWYESETHRNKLKANYLGLEVGDVKHLTYGAIVRSVRVDDLKYKSSGELELTWTRDNTKLATLSGSVGGTLAGRNPSVMPIPGLTQGFALDVNLPHDSYDNSTPFLMIAAAPHSNDVFWAGADVWHSNTGETSDPYEAGWASIPSSDKVTWGTTTTALPNALPDLYDEGSSLTVELKYGTLISVTHSDLLLDSTLNLVLIGQEWVQFTTATLVSGTTYTLTGFFRGMRGTEWATDGHVAGEKAVFFDSVWALRALGAGEIGDTDYYKFVSQGRPETSAYPQTVAFTAAANKPYAGCSGLATYDAVTGDWTIAWYRRTRIGGNNVNGQDVPLGETSESYEIDILDTDGTTVLRTITSSSDSITYTAAQQVTDFGAEVLEFDCIIYQMSPSLSIRGYPYALTVGTSAYESIITEDSEGLVTEAGEPLITE